MACPVPPRGSSSHSVCVCIMSTGATRKRRRFSSFTAGAITAGTGTGWRRRCARTGTSSAPICAGMATASGRRTAITRWRPTSTTWRSSSTSRTLAPVTIVAHSLGGNICLRYAGIYPDKVRKLVAIEGLGPSPKVIAERGNKPMSERMRELDRRAAQAVGPRAAQVPDASRTPSSACRRRTSISPPSRRVT